MFITQADDKIIIMQNGEIKLAVKTDHENAMEFLEFRLLAAMVTIEKAED